MCSKLLNQKSKINRRNSYRTKNKCFKHQMQKSSNIGFINSTTQKLYNFFSSNFPFLKNKLYSVRKSGALIFVS